MRALLLAAALIASAVGVARAGDPTRRYFTIETDHFIINYHAPLYDVARRLAVAAENAHRTLAPALDKYPKQKTILTLLDDTDSANGFASVIPRNEIQLYATAPPAFSELDDHDDWLHGLISHEYSHILHLDTMSGLPVIYNHIFGKTWSPNQLMPRWIIEGIATYEESKRGSGGRNRGTRFDQIIRIARHEHKDLRLDEAGGAPRQFPRGNAIYVYGSHFLRYIFDRYGDDTLRAMTHESGGFPGPYAVNRQIAKVVGKPFTELYDDWKGYLRDRYSLQEMAAERRGLRVGRALTRTGETNNFPQYAADGKELLWLASDGYHQATIRALPVGADASAARDVVQLDAIGPFDLLGDGSLVYEQGGWLWRRQYSYQDIFRYDARTHEIVRLTRGRRARDPSVSHDGRKVAFAQNTPAHSVLAVMDAVPDAPSSIVWEGGRWDQAYQPAWSPDGTRIAFSAWRQRGSRDILVVEVASGKVLEVTHDRAVDMAPAWSADGRYVYFDSDRSGIQNIFAYDTADGSLWQVTNVLGGAFFAHPSPDGARLAYQGAVAAGGYDLFEIAIDRAHWLPARVAFDDKPPAVDVHDDEARVSAPRPYRALETLAPQSYTAQVAVGAPTTISLQTGGSDAFNLHSYALAIGTDSDGNDLDVSASYAYGGWRPGVRFAGSRTVGTRNGFRVDGFNKPYRQEDWSATASLVVPFEQRPASSWTISADYDVDLHRLVGEPMIVLDPTQATPVSPLTDYVQAGVGTRVSYSRVRSVTYGVGPNIGFDASLSLRLDHPALGSDYRNVTVGYAADAYRRLPWGRTPVLSARLTGSLRAGELVRVGSFSLGGVPAQDVVQAIVDQTRFGVTGYLRGYAPRTITGNQFHLLNLEYRQELFPIEHGIATLPIYFRRVTFSGMSDIATAFDNRFEAGRNLRASVGAALRLDAFFGYFTPGTFEVGYARGLIDGGINETWLLLTGSL